MFGISTLMPAQPRKLLQGGWSLCHGVICRWRGEEGHSEKRERNPGGPLESRKGFDGRRLTPEKPGMNGGPGWMTGNPRSTWMLFLAEQGLYTTLPGEWQDQVTLHTGTLET